MTIERFIYDQVKLAFSDDLTVSFHPVLLPQTFTLPAIVYFRVSANEETTKQPARQEHISKERWQFTILSRKLTELDEIQQTLRHKFYNLSSEDFNIQRIWVADVGSQNYEEQLKCYTINIDFYINVIIQ